MNIFYKTHTDTELRTENRLLEIRSAFLFRLLHHLRDTEQQQEQQ